MDDVITLACARALNRTVVVLGVAPREVSMMRHEPANYCVRSSPIYIVREGMHYSGTCSQYTNREIDNYLPELGVEIRVLPF